MHGIRRCALGLYARIGAENIGFEFRTDWRTDLQRCMRPLAALLVCKMSALASKMTEVRHTPLKGNCLYATRDFAAGAAVTDERPLVHRHLTDADFLKSLDRTLNKLRSARQLSRFQFALVHAEPPSVVSYLPTYLHSCVQTADCRL
mgnify:CR=1 FL=1